MDKTDPDAVWNVYSGATNYSHVSGSRIPIPYREGALREGRRLLRCGLSSKFFDLVFIFVTFDTFNRSFSTFERFYYKNVTINVTKTRSNNLMISCITWIGMHCIG